MKLISWNVNGLRAVAAKDGFAWVSEQKPDFLGLQEIKVKEADVPSEIYKLGFNEISVNSAVRAGYSGVMSLSKFNTATQKSLFFNDDEGRVLEHRFGNVALFNIYFPNGQKDDARLAYKMDFYAKFLAYIDALVAQGLDVIFCGDVNTAHREIDLKNPKANAKTSGFLPIERAWLDEVVAHGFIDTFRQAHGDVADAYSWWSYRFNARAKNVGWRIDYFFISQSLKNRLKDAFILDDIGGSDHCPVGIEIEL
ncbi:MULTISPECIES: exodeoxyribonuclease III [Campylobacter]|uniref:exodeoxyribonuclease III n=1 Tax=Campylobacter TaxID=194 RepID=UPI00146FE921|nr:MULTISPECIES: exodeoxyribonuclease III [Campylobacter]MBN7288063.1 exodeoxyribonuclease III [Campylobacter curvus]MDU6828044.1 exodeoxyribonuclease III [Campylobacter sp.]